MSKNVKKYVKEGIKRYDLKRNIDINNFQVCNTAENIINYITKEVIELDEYISFLDLNQILYTIQYLYIARFNKLAFKENFIKRENQLIINSIIDFNIGIDKETEIQLIKEEENLIKNVIYNYLELNDNNNDNEVQTVDTSWTHQDFFDSFKEYEEVTNQLIIYFIHIFCIENADGIYAKYGSIEELCKRNRISPELYKSRLMNGWTYEEIYGEIESLKNKYISMGEEQIIRYLEKEGIKYINNKTIKTIFKNFNLDVDWDDFSKELLSTLKSNNIKGWNKTKIEKFKPDFVLYKDKNNKIIGVLEYDGQQHFCFIHYIFKVAEKFIKQCDADTVKSSLWEYLNIPMLRIRYDQIDMVDNMLSDFIPNPQKYITNHNTYFSENEYWKQLNYTLDYLGYNPS